MLYLFPSLYKDTLLPDSDLCFIHKGKDKRDYKGRDVWQPVVKILPFVYVNRKISSAFVDFKENFEKI